MYNIFPLLVNNIIKNNLILLKMSVTYTIYVFFGHKATFFHSCKPADAHTAGFLFVMKGKMPPSIPTPIFNLRYKINI